MVCDLNVENAHFQVNVQFQTEQIWNNEIYPAGATAIWNAKGSLIFQGVEVSSLDAAVQNVRGRATEAAAVIVRHMRREYLPRYIHITDATAINSNEWEVVLERNERQMTSTVVDFFNLVVE